MQFTRNVTHFDPFGACRTCRERAGDACTSSDVRMLMGGTNRTIPIPQARAHTGPCGAEAKHHVPHPHLTERALRATWDRERPYRPHWPDRYEDGMADPLISRVVELLARHVPTYGRRAQERAHIDVNGRRELEACEDPPPPHEGFRRTGPAPLDQPIRMPPPLKLDRKRLASGERDDD